MGRARRGVHGSADDGARRDDRERRAALDAARPWLLAGEPGVGDRCLPDRVRQLPAAGGTARRPTRPQADVPHRAGRVHARLGGVRDRRRSGRIDRGPVHPGARWRPRIGGGAGPADHGVSEAVGPRDRDERVHVHRLERRIDRPARRRRAHAVAELALDLLHQRADRDRDVRARKGADQRDRAHRRRPGRRRPRRGARDRVADARRLRDRQGHRIRLALGRIRSASARCRWH